MRQPGDQCRLRMWNDFSNRSTSATQNRIYFSSKRGAGFQIRAPFECNTIFQIVLPRTQRLLMFDAGYAIFTRIHLQIYGAVAMQFF